MDKFFPSLRKQFPSLQRCINGRTPIYLDGPGGTQVPQQVIDAMSHYLSNCNANHAGSFVTSHESDVILEQAHHAVADLLNAPSADEIIFGQNMTTLTFHMSRSLGRTWKTGDEIVVTKLDHDANVRPWVLAARDAGATVRFVDFHIEDGTLNLDDFQSKLNENTKLVAIGAASNLLGTINDVKTLTKWAHEVGALVYVDAVHYVPHGPIDVQEWGCDFLACSAYKFFGPHVGILWGKREHLESLEAYKVKPAPDDIPGRWMTGTQNHEGIAGVKAAIEYLNEIGTMSDIKAYEKILSHKLLEDLAARPAFKVYGITDLEQLDWRVPTISITHERHSPQAMAEHLAKYQIFTWAGNMYALEVTEHLQVEKSGGLLRLGMVHYNDPEEIDTLIQALDELP